MLAALGPKMVTLSATRAGGAHPYRVTPVHTGRQIETDWLRAYLALPNYANNQLRSSFSEDDLSQVSDRFFNAIIAWGDEEAIMRRVAEHRSAGADDGCVQVLRADPRHSRGRNGATSPPPPGDRLAGLE